jgi:protein TonB
MFEQSILLDHQAAKRTGALAASLSMQALAVGGLLLVPLIYNDRMPGLRPFLSLPLPLQALSPPPPEPVQRAATTTSTRSSFPVMRAFSLPAPAHPRSDPVVLNGIAPTPDAAPGLVGEPPGGGFNALPRNVDVPKAQAVVTASHEPPRPVGGDVQAARLIKKVLPVYPALAKQARVSGTVRLIGIVGKDGTIQKLEVQSGHPLLVRAAAEAVRQWVYRPTLLNGEPIEVIAPIDVNFTLTP